MIIFVNGQYVNAKHAVISPYDHGYLYGLGVFETFRIYEGHPFLFNDHYNRLNRAVRELNISWSMSKEEVLAVLEELLERNDLRNAYVRFNVSAGVGEIGLQTEEYTSPTTIVFIKSLPVQDEVIEKTGVILKQTRNTPEGMFRLKSHHYLNNILGKREIGADPDQEGIFLTKEGHVAEGIVSNVFFVKDRRLCTPSLETGILNGITREFVLCMAETYGIQSNVGLFTEDDLFTSEEVFVTNSIQEIVPIKQIGDVVYKGKQGEITSFLAQEYKVYRKTLWKNDELKGMNTLGSAKHQV
ncbi:aminodeoxychorismate lyase [Bacillus sp. 165]|uniref:aminodeoxychorismate lyase n=1 Tax=Bacillus sp. 165 TaxID=1529117 RepID=UPI001ADB69B9|nr:aminodeoxychorismate lyase [Bacillus sp. 165]MBO9131323.1 aminodeoxychorismate lyase [Bacillus sp. 165]